MPQDDDRSMRDSVLGAMKGEFEESSMLDQTGTTDRSQSSRWGVPREPAGTPPRSDRAPVDEREGDD